MLVRIYHFLYGSRYPYRKYTHKYQTIFIHVPKVAGTSILTSLMGDKVNRDHLTYREFKQSNSFLYDKYFKFCFVRNPYDRIVSVYEYLKSGGNQASDKYFQEIINNHYDTFESFVLEYLNAERIHEHVLFKPQYLFIYNEQGDSEVDFCGRYEKLEDDAYFVFKKLGVESSLPLKNRTLKNSDIADYYKNKSVKEKVGSLYHKDFEIFSYEV